MGAWHGCTVFIFPGGPGRTAVWVTARPLRSQDPPACPGGCVGLCQLPAGARWPSHCPRWAAIKAERQLTWSVVLTVRQGCRLHAREQEGGRGGDRAQHPAPPCRQAPRPGLVPRPARWVLPWVGRCPRYRASSPPRPRPGLRRSDVRLLLPSGPLRSTWAPEVPAPLMGGVGILRVGVPSPSSEGPGQGLQMAIVPAMPPGVPATQTLWGRLW